jgi:hypothetical protein
MADGHVTLNRNGFDREIDAQSPHRPSDPLGVPGFIVPTSLSEVKELARMIALAEWAPECYRDVDGNYLQPKIELAIMHGATVGLGPIAAVHSIALIGGKPSVWGDGALSVIEHSGLLEDMVEDYELDGDEGLVAVCTMKRRHRATPIVTRFSMAMAERAGLTRSEGPWQTYPERMLRMRARSWTMRDAFADVLRGLQLREEVEDYAGSRGGRRGRAPQGEGSPQEGQGHYSSPRPRRPAAPVAARRPDERPTAISVRPQGGHNQDQLVAASFPADETYTLVDADGVVIEVTGPDALRVGLERLISEKHLSPDQIAGVWESNEPARQTIERLFGRGALDGAEGYLRSIQGMRNPSSNDQWPQSGAASHHSAADSAGPGESPLSEPNRALALEVDPTWGVQKIFQHYRAALTALSDEPNRSKRTIARFRQANIAVEQRLRAKLPGRIGQIDGIYQRAGIDL